MQIVWQTESEMVCEEKQPYVVILLLLGWTIFASALLLPLLLLFAQSWDWLNLLVLLLLLISVLYPAATLPMNETLTINKTTDQILYEHRALVRFQHKRFKLSEVTDFSLERNTNSAGYRYYTLFIKTSSGSHKVLDIYGKHEVEKLHQSIRKFIL